MFELLKTTPVEPAEPTAVFDPVVRVSEFGGDERSIPYESSLSLAQYLARAGIETPLSRGQSVSVNGSVVSDLGAKVDPNAVVVVAGHISNG